jgi:hypothetical protein
MLGVSARAQEPQSVLGYTKSTSFWVDIPTGWKADGATAQKHGAIFILLPGDATFDSSPYVIVASSFSGTTLAAAMQRDKDEFLSQDPSMRISDLAPAVTAKGIAIPLREFRSTALHQQGFEIVAYVAQDGDVVAITYSAQTQAQYKEGRPIFASLLKTFQDAKLKVQDLR